MSLCVRVAAPRDIPVLAALFRQEAEYQCGLTDSFELELSANWYNHVAARIQRQGGVVIVAELKKEMDSGDTLVGFIDIRVVHRGQPPKLSGRWFLPFLKRPRASPGPLIKPHSVGFIDGIFVEPDSRRQKVATRLIQASWQWFSEQQVREVEAAVWSSNEASRHFFSRLGFESARILMKKGLY